jgi:hypothetical protein
VDYTFQLQSQFQLFKEYYEGWLVRSGYDVGRVRLLSALVHLNMSPLHPAPVGDLLFYHATLKLAYLTEGKP